jgi:hypothetical protein
VPVEEKSAYIKQTVAYQASDVRIGFLVVLRLTPPAVIKLLMDIEI